MGEERSRPARTMAKAAAERPRDLLVSGHVIIDRFLSVRAFPEADRTVPVVSMRTELGGTATNIALAASRLGVATGLVTRLGEGFPPGYLARFRAAGIDIRGVVQVRGRSTSTCYIIEDADGAQRTLIDQGAMTDSRSAPLPLRWLSEYSWVHLTTVDPAFQLRLQRAARDPAQVIHQDEVIFGLSTPISHDALEDRRHSHRLDHQSCLFQHLAPDGVFQAFSRLDRAAGQRPITL